MTALTAEALTLLQMAIEGKLNSYALVYRPDRYKKPTLEVLVGSERVLDNLSEFDQVQREQSETDQWGTLLVAPYRQIEERGYTVINDQVPFLALEINDCKTLPLGTALADLPDAPINLKTPHFKQDDKTYEEIVKQVIQQEIGAGEGANFVIKRTLTGDIDHYEDRVGLTIFRNLLRQETGAYWTFFIRMNGVTLVGASPEMHIKLNNKKAVMTPISGTYRFPTKGPTQEGLLAFLQNAKEEYELSMVLDEELKMMTNICAADVNAQGPYLIQMSRLAHVGYRIEGATELPISQILKRSMFAPTVTGSPLENATRVIARYETCGRSYYSGFTALIENNDNGPLLDSAILIRTAEITNDGKMEVGVGATLVRDSDPRSETQETAAKAAALQNAMGVNTICSLSGSEPIVESLSKRNERLSNFWLRQGDQARNFPLIAQREGPSVVILDNEDAFTSMMEYQLKALGLTVKVKSYSAMDRVNDNELLVVGPGPGDPRKQTDPRVITSRYMMMSALELNQPFIAVCFGHQVLCSLLGLPIRRLHKPNQGLQKQISVFGKTETVGFYNTFTAISENTHIESPAGKVQVYRDLHSKQVYGLQGPSFCSMQFHPESVLTMDGPRILKDAILSVNTECVLN
ncbi:phenazine-specific anthranilate synthase [Endozoicomonas sp. SM1973]|uniref:anthranilate synthase n=1 Tax=Spartinivicinus marinus TaxID=2994442 RepID=A0A853ICV8_9GAMM|nr:anthranilate synthase family protein [Spartinivicinus marinus]MCX4028189.1 anthranilate synthase family protein [Spartinivicinus marinus]NYZ68388.1 phenazine-specific anthranilate synthase [Spartinivicinus marinus]